MDRSQSVNVTKIKKPDGSLCETPEENSEVFRTHFEVLYSSIPNTDESLLDHVKPISIPANDALPPEDEIRKATQSLHNTAPGNSGLPAQLWKALLQSEETFSVFCEIVMHFWLSECTSEDWNIGLLKILPKKGDLKLPGNYRGIMMLEAAYKVVGIILHGRLLPISEGLDHENQCGFRPGRSCTDIFNIKSALKKRSEHGLIPCVLFIDLVKAFDRTPRSSVTSPTQIRTSSKPRKVNDMPPFQH